jgi:cysteinyl-tRNA synthetase
MSIRVYNTLSRKKENFEPIEPGKIRMYVCGPTVYDYLHIGNARSVVVFDVIVRYLRARGYDVKYVRNFTDVDDKIINRANELGINSADLSAKFIDIFYQDMKALNVQKADYEPKVTEYIDEIKELVSVLIQNGHAYQVDGDVFYSVQTFKDYGKLSGRRPENMEPGARVKIDERKQNPIDFALWKSAKPGEPSWDSPWGKGRPGWHIECSAMSYSLLGETFDIHGGGKDLIFPHHENEIAQSEGAFKKPFAKYWLHNGFVNINHEKMSKSLGNFLTIRDVMAKYNPEAVRLFLLSNHYRSPVDYTDSAMDEATVRLDRIYALLDRIDNETGTDEKDQPEGSCWNQFCQAMDDDFNTALGMGTVFDAVRSLNSLLDNNKRPFSADTEHAILSQRADILKIGQVIGILNQSPEKYFENKKSKALERESVDPALIEEMIKKRVSARKKKDWKAADQIRKELENMNIIIEDRPKGTVWKVKA